MRYTLVDNQTWTAQAVRTFRSEEDLRKHVDSFWANSAIWKSDDTVSVIFSKTGSRVNLRVAYYFNSNVSIPVKVWDKRKKGFTILFNQEKQHAIIPANLIANPSDFAGVSVYSDNGERLFGGSNRWYQHRPAGEFQVGRNWIVALTATELGDGLLEVQASDGRYFHLGRNNLKGYERV